MNHLSIARHLALLIMLISGVSTATAEPPAIGDKAPEIRAKCWFNAQPVFLQSPPKLVLLEFWTKRSRECRDFVEPLAGIHKAMDDGRLLIAALTKDECPDAREFIAREDLEYKIGADSRSHEAYGVTEFPAVFLVDATTGLIVGRWLGREVKPIPIAKAILQIIGDPKGMVVVADGEPELNREAYFSQVEQLDSELESITSQILATEGEVGPKSLEALDGFYRRNVPVDPAEDSSTTRAQGYARGALVSSLNTGYCGLFASGRLNEAGQTAIRERVIEMAETDRAVRIPALGALRNRLGKPGDQKTLERLRRMLAKETEPLVRASIEHTLEDLDPKKSATKNTERTTQPIALRAKRSLGEALDPASSPWASAYAYRQTVASRSPEELLQEYWASPEPPIDDSVEIENAALKRDAGIGELNNRIARGEISDLTGIKDHFARALSEEPDPYIRKYIAWSGLRAIAEKEGSAVRAEIIQLFEKRLPEEPDRYVRSSLEAAITELKAKP